MDIQVMEKQLKAVADANRLKILADYWQCEKAK